MEREERERLRRLVGSGLPVSPAGCFMTPIIHCWALHFAQMLNTFQMSMSDDSMLFKMIQYSNVKIYDDRYHDLSQEGQWLAKKSHKWMWSLFPFR